MFEKLKKSGRITTINLFKPSTKEQLRDAVTEWLNNESNNSYGGLHISYWDTSLITDMSELFKLQSNFNEDISGWNVSNVTNFNEMFKGASSFNQNLDSWVLNSSNSITMNGMFDGANSFNGSINNWNVDRVTEMNSMFWRASKFNQPLNNWNVSRVLSMNGMFGHATSFNQDLSSWILNDNCNIENIFSYSTSLSEENRSNFASIVDETIYVSAGFSSSPYYKFYENSDRTNEINSLILDINKTYKFQMLSNSYSHPFYIGNNGWRKQSTNKLNFGGTGSFSQGLNAKNQYFTLSFNGSISDIGTLIYYCTNQYHSWMKKSITLINNNNINNSPILSSIGNQNFDEGSNLTITLSASDADNDSLTFSISGGSNIRTQINGNQLTFFSNSNWNGTEQFTATVSDGSLSHSEIFNVTVNAVNDGDASFSIFGDLIVGSTLKVNKTSNDPDGNGTFLYKWYSSTNKSNWNLILSKYSNSYTLIEDDVNKYMKCIIKYNDGDGFNESITVETLEKIKSEITISLNINWNLFYNPLDEQVSFNRNNISSLLIEYELNDSNIVPSNTAFWIQSSIAKDLLMYSYDHPKERSKTLTIPIGWSIIGVEVESTINLEDILLYEFTSEGYKSNSGNLKPFIGYWIYSEKIMSITL